MFFRLASLSLRSFLDTRPLSLTSCPPILGFFSDAALTVFVDTVYANLGETTVLISGGDLTSDAVKPLKGK